MSERKATLSIVLPNAGARMRWDYDFGDGWEHDVVCESIGPRVRGTAYPAVIGGKRACPPEDCGGPYGYAELVEALGDPAHEDSDPQQCPHGSIAILNNDAARRRGRSLSIS